jgi:hypothetical protein
MSRKTASIGDGWSGWRRLVERRRGVGTDSEFTYDSSGWRWQWACTPAADDATDQPTDDIGARAKSAGPSISSGDVVSVAERQSAHAGSKTAGRHARATATGRAGNKFTTHTKPAVAQFQQRAPAAECCRQHPATAGPSRLQSAGFFVAFERPKRGAAGRTADRPDERVQRADADGAAFCKFRNQRAARP